MPNQRYSAEFKEDAVRQVFDRGYYAWLHQPKSNQAKEDRRLLALIQASWLASGKIYGSPRVDRDLREADERVGRNRIARVMRENKIRAVRDYQRPRYRAARASMVAPSVLQQNFTVSIPDEAWVTDITYPNLARMVVSRGGHRSLLSSSGR